MAISHFTALNLSAAINALMNVDTLDILQIQEHTRDLLFEANVEFMPFNEFKEDNEDEETFHFTTCEDWFFEKINHKAIDYREIYERIQQTIKPKSIYENH